MSDLLVIEEYVKDGLSNLKSDPMIGAVIDWVNGEVGTCYEDIAKHMPKKCFCYNIMAGALPSSMNRELMHLYPAVLELMKQHIIEGALERDNETTTS